LISQSYSLPTPENVTQSSSPLYKNVWCTTPLYLFIIILLLLLLLFYLFIFQEATLARDVVTDINQATLATALDDAIGEKIAARISKMNVRKLF